jgi:mono/diheme cytochrome c family protein
MTVTMSEGPTGQARSSATRWFKRLFYLILLAIAVVVIIVGGLGIQMSLTPVGSEPLAPISGAPANLSGLARGEYIARAADCVACHTAPGGQPYAGGLAFKLPFGTISSTNITPDKETGIGNWTDDQFVSAVREGVGSKGRLYPAMPYTSYSAMSRDDVLAIKSFLFSLAPVNQTSPTLELPFPFNQRWGLNFWNLAFFREQRFAPEPSKDAAWNRGAYLATALGHCAECHTPRNAGFALEAKSNLSGSLIEGWKAYNATSDDQYGIGGWTDQQLSDFLSKGHADGRSSAVGPMAEVVENSLQHLSANDIAGLVKYLRDVPAQEGSNGVSVSLNPSAASGSSSILPSTIEVQAQNRGRALFQGECASCHQWDGVGRQTPFASLVGSRSVNDPNGSSVVQVLLKGAHIDVDGRTRMMPAFASHSNADIAALANFVVKHFGDRDGTVTSQQVQKQRGE